MSLESWNGGYVPGEIDDRKLFLAPKQELVPLKDSKEINKAKDALLKAQSALSRVGLSEKERGEWEDKKAELVKILRASGQAI